MAETNSVKFYQGTSLQFQVAEKDDNTLYFITDERRIYKGNVPFSGGIYRTVSDFPTEGQEVNTLYVNTSTQEVRYWNGNNWQVVTYPVSTTVPADSEQLSDEIILTEKAVIDYIDNATTNLGAVNDLTDQVNDINDYLDTLKADENTSGSLASIEKQVNDLTKVTIEEDEEGVLTNIPVGPVAVNAAEIQNIKNLIGTVEEGSTVVEMINSAVNLTSLYTDLRIKVTEEGASATAAKTYKIYQGPDTVYTPDEMPEGEDPETWEQTYSETPATPVGIINIPKDMVVSSGEVVEVTSNQIGTEGYPETGSEVGQYIKLTINNGDVLWIAAKDLVDVYTAEQSAAQVQVAVSATNEISATIVAGSVSATELAANAIETAKIKDGAVTVDKLAADAVETAKIKDGAVTADKLSSALQTAINNIPTDTISASDIEEGSTNGTIAVDGTDVAVHGLKSAAYTESSDYATAAQGALADSAVQAVTEGTTDGTVSVDGTDVAVHGLKSAAYVETTAFDVAGAATAAETAAKSYADGLLAWNSL